MSIINTINGEEEDSFSIFAGGLFPITWKPNPAFTQAYGVAPYLNSAIVWDMDLVTGAVTTFTLPTGGARGASIAYSADGSKVYITDNANTSVHIYNTSNNTEIGSGLTVGSAPHSNAFRPGHDEVWVANSLDNTISVISTVSDTVIDTFAAGSQPNGLTFSSDGEVAYVGQDSGGGAISVIDADTGTVTDTISGSGTPEVLTITEDDSTVYASHPAGNTVDVFDTASGTLTDTVTVGTGAWSMALNEDNSLLYVTNPNLLGGLNGTTISVIDTSNNTVVDTLTPGGGAPFFVWAAPAESATDTISFTLAQSGVAEENDGELANTGSNAVLLSSIAAAIMLAGFFKLLNARAKQKKYSI